MGTFFKLILTALFLYTVGWYVAYQMHRPSVCTDHPNPKKMDKYYECKFISPKIKFDLERNNFMEGSFRKQILINPKILNTKEEE